MTVAARAGAGGAPLATAAGLIAICLLVPMAPTSCPAWPLPVAWPGSCAATALSIPAGALAAVLLTAAAIAVMLVGSVLHQGLVHRRLSKTLDALARPATLADHLVGLIPGLRNPVVAGIRRPRVYCSDDLAARLDSDEVRAVLLHERHHQLSFAPARLVILSGLAPIVGRVVYGHAWLDRQRALLEIAADEYALRSGASRAALARALLKLQVATPAPTTAGFATANELRLRVLLGDPPAIPGSHDRRLALALTIGVALACGVFGLG